MKLAGLLLGLMVVSLCRLPAQVTVDVSLSQEQFLPGEALPAQVLITNRLGQTLHLGGDSDWLTFTVESRDGYVVLKTGEAPVAGEFALESSKRAVKRVDLAPCFNLAKPGRYSVVANVTIKEWNRQISSQPRFFDIIEGGNIWEKDIGVPRSAEPTNQALEVRKYTLQQANHLHKGLKLYVRLTDTTGKINKVVPLGPMLSFGQPDPQVDKLSNLHVLYQDRPHSFNYTVVNPDGDVTVRQVYDYTTRPRLSAGSDGSVSVTGGRRRVTPQDLPVKPADSGATNSLR